jgi:hypothetical protein
VRRRIAAFMDLVLQNRSSEVMILAIREEVRAFSLSSHNYGGDSVNLEGMAGMPRP